LREHRSRTLVPEILSKSGQSRSCPPQPKPPLTPTYPNLPMCPHRLAHSRSPPPQRRGTERGPRPRAPGRRRQGRCRSRRRVPARGAGRPCA
jgi:hypothetical protein